MQYIEAPNRPAAFGHTRLFLAGGITGCPDWQDEMVRKLKDEPNLIILNPRRADFPIGDPRAAYEQIKWEHDMLRDASRISFWFPKETICPIVLYELGAWCMTSKVLYVGLDRDYKRRQDVEIQTELIRPEIDLAYSLDDLVGQVRADLERDRYTG